MIAVPVPPAVRDPLLDRAIAALPAREARIVEMRYFLDLDQRDVAALLGISRHAVRRAELAAIAELRRRVTR